MPWWGWMILGAFLLGSELMMIVDAAFFLVFIGAAAIATGAVVLAGVALEPWAQWLLFSGLAVVCMVFFRKRLYDRLRAPGVGYQDGLGGERIRLDEALEPGARARQSYRGTDWTVVNRGSTALAAGAEVTIDHVEGATIILTDSASMTGVNTSEGSNSNV